MNEHLMTNPAEVKTFALAGNARLTLVSKATKARFSYRVKASDDGAVHFVSVLTAPDNENGYSYLGIVGKDGSFRVTAKSKIAEDAPSAKAFAWFWKLVEAGKLHDALEVWHEGRCGRCNRALTVPESIANGIGPECAKHVLGPAPSFPFEVDEVIATKPKVAAFKAARERGASVKEALAVEPATVKEKVAELEKRGYTRTDAGTGREHPLADSDWPDNGKRMSLTELAAAFNR